MKALILSSPGLYPPSKRADVLTRKLALGILLQALRDVTANPASISKEKQYWRTDALEWFASTDPGPGSLDWVCAILQVEADGLRELTRLYSSPDSSAPDRRSLFLKLAHGLRN